MKESQQTQFSFDLAFEEDLLALILKKPALTQGFKVYLKPHHFQKLIHQDLYSLILDYEQKFDELPTERVLRQECQKYLKDKSGNKPDLVRYEKAIKSLFTSEIQAEQYIITTVAEFIKQVAASEAVIGYSESQHTPQDRKKLLEAVTISEQLDIDPEQKRKDLLQKGLFFQDLMHKELPKAKFYIGRGLMPTTGYVILGGYTKRGKTTLTTQMSLCLTNALPFLEFFPIPEKVRVLYLDGEGNPTEFQDRLRHEVTGLRLKGFKINIADMDFRYQPGTIDILSKKGYQELDFMVEIFKPQVVIIDPVMKFSGSRDMNRLENATAFTNILDQIALDKPCVWFLVHHNKKPQEKQSTDPIYQLIGSSAWGSLCQTFIGIKRSPETQQNRKKLTFETRHAEPLDPMYLWQNEARIHELIKQDEPIRKNVRVQDLVDILSTLGGHSSWTEIMREVKAKYGLSSGVADELLKSAGTQGLISKAPGKRGGWAIT